MKRRILFFTNGLYGGGAERVLQTLLSHLNPDLFHVTVYSLREETINDCYPTWAQYKHIFASSGNNFWQRIWNRIGNIIKLIIYRHLSPTWFYRFFVRGNYDVEIAFIEGYATRIISGSTNRKSKKLAWVHIDLKQNHWTLEHHIFHNRDEEWKCYSNFDSILCVSQTVKKSLQELYPSLTNVEVCYNPIDSDYITGVACQEIKSSEFIKCKDGITFISIGRLVPQKGYDRLIPIMAKIRDLGYKFTLNILGEGTDRQLLERLITKHKLTERVHLIGFQNNPYPYLAQSDVFLCSSRSEGYSTVVTEAYILGIPTISTQCSGMDELIHDGADGLICENDDDALNKTIQRFFDKNLYNTLKASASHRTGDFSITKAMQRVINIIDQ